MLTPEPSIVRRRGLNLPVIVAVASIALLQMLKDNAEGFLKLCQPLMMSNDFVV
jgi:hypothetical protein